MSGSSEEEDEEGNFGNVRIVLDAEGVSLRSFVDSGIDPSSSIQHSTRVSEAGSTTEQIQEQNEIAVDFLGGPTEELLISRIFCFLNAAELAMLGLCCRHFSKITASPKLWSNLLKTDFLLEEEAESSGRNSALDRRSRLGQYRLGAANMGLFNFSFARSSSSAASTTVSPKSQYIRKFRDVHTRIEGKREERAEYQLSIARHWRVTALEWVLDATLVRVLIPLPLIAIFASLLLVGLYYDGVGVPMWVVAAPVLFLFFYFVICVVIMCVVFRGRGSGSLVGLWSRLNCPLKSFYQDVFHESKKLVGFALLGILLGLVQVLLVAVKLSVHLTPSHILNQLHWGVVFLPLWLLLFMFCISPGIRFITDRALFFSLLILLWVPLFIISVCLVIKLDGEEHHNSHRHMRLALIFMPLWVIEGVILVGSLLAIIIVYQRQVFTVYPRQFCCVILFAWIR